MELTTPRFLLRDFHPDDQSALVAYQADMRYLAQYGAQEPDPEASRRLLRRFLRWAAESPRLNYQLAIVRRADGELIGCGGLRTADCEPGTAEMGIEFAPWCWGRYRYAVEVAEALLAFGFQQLHLHCIFGRTRSDNHRVARLAKWFGAEAIPDLAPGTSPLSTATRWRLARERWEHTLRQR